MTIYRPFMNEHDEVEFVTIPTPTLTEQLDMVKSKTKLGYAFLSTSLSKEKETKIDDTEHNLFVSITKLRDVVIEDIKDVLANNEVIKYPITDERVPLHLKNSLLLLKEKDVYVTKLIVNQFVNDNDKEIEIVLTDEEDNIVGFFTCLQDKVSSISKLILNKEYKPLDTDGLKHFYELNPYPVSVGKTKTVSLIKEPPKFLPATNLLHEQSVIRKDLSTLELLRQIDVPDTLTKHLHSKMNQGYLYAGLTTEKLSYRELFEDKYLFVKGEITESRMANLEKLLSSSEVPFENNNAEENIVLKTCKVMSRLVDRKFPLIRILQFNKFVDTDGNPGDVIIFTCKRTNTIVGYFYYNNGSPIMFISDKYEL